MRERVISRLGSSDSTVVARYMSFYSSAESEMSSR